MKCAILAILCLITFQCKCEHLFTRPGGAGARNGSDWNNAFSYFEGVAWGDGNGQVGAGDTLWAAGGAYGRLEIRGNGGLDNLIFIKRARADQPACRQSPGWDSSFDSQVRISCIPASNPVGIHARFGYGNYVTVDGMVWAGIRLDIDHRFAIERGAAVTLYDSGSVIGFTFQNGLIVGVRAANNQDHQVRGMIIGARAGFLHRNLAFNYIELSTLGNPIVCGRNDGLIIDHCYIHESDSFGGDDHSNSIATHSEGEGPNNVHIRYCRSENNDGEGWILGPDRTDNFSVNRNIYLYGNTFKNCRGKCIQISVVNVRIDNIQVLNNVFYNCVNPVRLDIRQGVANAFTGGCYNNIVFGSPAPESRAGFPRDYNWYSGSSAQGEPNGIAGGSVNPFTDQNTFHIVEATGPAYPRNKGTVTAFTTDYDGDRRIDGFPDIGADEIGTATISPPSNLRIVP